MTLFLNFPRIDPSWLLHPCSASGRSSANRAFAWHWHCILPSHPRPRPLRFPSTPTVVPSRREKLLCALHNHRACSGPCRADPRPKTLTAFSVAQLPPVSFRRSFNATLHEPSHHRPNLRQREGLPLVALLLSPTDHAHPPSLAPCYAQMMRPAERTAYTSPARAVGQMDSSLGHRRRNLSLAKITIPTAASFQPPLPVIQLEPSPQPSPVRRKPLPANASPITSRYASHDEPRPSLDELSSSPPQPLPSPRTHLSSDSPTVPAGYPSPLATSNPSPGNAGLVVRDLDKYAVFLGVHIDILTFVVQIPSRNVTSLPRAPRLANRAESLSSKTESSNPTSSQ